MSNLTKGFVNAIRKNSPLLVSVVASVGVIATAVLAVRETPKALKIIEKETEVKEEPLTKKETVKVAWKCYIPAAAVGASTIACILCANGLNRRQQALITSAYALVNESYKEYKDTVKNVLGEEAHNRVIDNIAKAHINEDPIYCPGIFGDATTLYIDDSTDEKEVVRTFYDVYSKQYFETTLSRVIEAEYHLNRNIILGDTPSVNKFYELLGLDPVKDGDIYGWDYCDGISWVDFNHRVTKMDDGLEIVMVEMVFEPALLCDI